MTLPFDKKTGNYIDPIMHGNIWFQVIQYDQLATIINKVLIHYPNLIRKLIEVKDESLKPALFIASNINQQVLLNQLNCLDRFHVLNHLQYDSYQLQQKDKVEHHQQQDDDFQKFINSMISNV